MESGLKLTVDDVAILGSQTPNINSVRFDTVNINVDIPAEWGKGAEFYMTITAFSTNTICA